MLSLRDALSVIFKRKTVIVAFFLTLVVVSFAVMKIKTPTYAASSKILVKIGREDIYTPSITSEALVSPLISVIREEQLNSEVQILTSDNLAKKLITDMTPEGIYPGISKRHPWYTPKGVMQMMIGVYKGVERFFTPFGTKLSVEEKALKRFTRKDLEVKGTGNSNVIEVTVYNKIPALAADTANKLVDLYLSERSRIHNDAEGAIFAAQLKDMESRLEQSQAALRAFRAMNQMTDVDAERESLLKRLGEARAMSVDLAGRPAEAQRRQKWEGEIGSIEQQLNKLAAEELEYVRLTQDVEVLKKSRQLYLEKLEEHRINAALGEARVGNVTVISRAMPPLSPAKFKFWMILLALMAIGPIGGVALAFLLEFLDDTLETDGDVKKYLGLPVMGKIGYIGTT